MNLPNPARPYRPRRLGYAPAITPLFGRRPILVPLETDHLQIRFTPPPQPGADWLTLTFQIGQQHGTCRIAHGVMRMLLRMAEPRPRAPLDANVAMLLLEMLFDAPLTRLETLLKGPFALQALDISPTAGIPAEDHQLGFRASFGAEETFDGLLTLSSPLLNTLRHTAPPLERPLPSPPVAVSIRIATLMLDQHALSTLTPGCGLVLGSTLTPMLVAGDHLMAHAIFDGTRIICKTPLTPATPAAHTERTGMTSDTNPPETTPPESGVSELRIPLSFEIGRKTMTLAELQQIGEGHVLEIGPLRDHAVSVLANGQRIAEGELVEIGQSIAVRLTRIAGS